ncbi:unnamed protein product, partial [Ranitomeya imitator]
GSFFLQLQGTAMGAAFAPSYANLFLGLWERDLFMSDQHASMDRVPLWTRYIDDIFLVWQGSSHELDMFMMDLNSNDLNIRLTHTSNSDFVEFLDVTVKRGPNGEINSDVYRKPTSTNLLLHASSSHPRHMIQSVPVGQFLRLRRICSSDTDFERQAEDLKNRFLERGYSRRVLKRAYNRARHSHRNDLLYKPTNVNRQPDNQSRFITNFNCHSTSIRSALQRSWHVLQVDPILAKFLPERPPITFRRSKNLRDLLTRSHYEEEPRVTFLNQGNPRSGCVPCGHCVACCNIDRSDTFSNSSGSKVYKIKKFITCTTRYVIYYAVCPCGLIYVGLTTRLLKVRVREHVLGIQAAAGHTDASTLKTIPRHFKEFHQCNSDLLRTTQELRKRARKHISTVHLAASDLRKGRILTPVAEHFLVKHGGSSANLKVVGLQKLTPNERGGDRRKHFYKLSPDGSSNYNR